MYKYNREITDMSSLELMRKQYIEIAMDFYYPDDCIKDIKKAINEYQMEQALRNARKGNYDNLSISYIPV